MNVNKKKNVYTIKVVISILLCCYVCGLMSCSSNKSKEEKAALAALESFEPVSPEGSDILYFARNLIKNHYGISNLVSVNEFYEEAIAAAKRLDEATEAGIQNKNGIVTADISRLISLYFELCKLAAMLHDGHTGISFPQEINPYLEFYPFNASVIDGKLIVTAISTEYQNVVGKEVVELNGKTVDQILSALKQIISFDTEAFAVDQACKRINMRAALDFTGIGSDDGILRMKFSDGTELSFEPLSFEAFNDCSFNTLVTSVERTLYEDSFYPTHARPYRPHM